jgi:hypothetical protein
VMCSSREFGRLHLRSRSRLNSAGARASIDRMRFARTAAARRRAD